MGRRYRSKYQRFEDVSFHGIADKGAVVGRDPEGTVVFTRGVVPGDKATVMAKKKKGVFQEGQVVSYSTFSEGRQAPFCEHFGACGGCSYQHMTYAAQLEAKSTLVQDAYDRIGKLNFQLEPILGALETDHYRNKMEYAFSDRRWLTEEEMAMGYAMDHAALGFHRRGAWNKVLNINKCHLQLTVGDRVRNVLRLIGEQQALTFYSESKNEGFLRKAMIRTLDTGDTMLLLMFGYRDDKAAKAYLDAVKNQCPEITSIHAVINTKLNDSMYGLTPEHYWGKKLVQEQLGHVLFNIGPLSFFQTNTKQAKRLYDVIAEYAELDGSQNLYDLYAGVGSIGLYLANKAKQIVAIEEIESAIEDASENAKLNQIENFIGYAGDVKAILTAEFANKHGKPDVVITDPPRAGMHADVVQMLIQLAAPRIVYVSCNPSTQARDLKMLVEGGYKLKRAKGVDMFPQTPHCEAVAVLELA